MKNIKDIARKIATERGLINLTKSELCESVGIAPGSFSHFNGGTFTSLIESLRAEGIPTGTTVSTKRTSARLRRGQILEAAIIQAETTGYDKMTRVDIAERAGVSEALITHYFGTMIKLRRDVVRYAVSHGCVPVVAQALAIRDPHVKNAPPDLITRALDYVEGGHV